MQTFQVRDYARSLESGWIGRIEAIEPDEYGTLTARMIGVDRVAHAIMGMSLEDSLSPDDTQWFHLADLLPYRKTA